MPAGQEKRQRAQRPYRRRRARKSQLRAREAPPRPWKKVFARAGGVFRELPRPKRGEVSDPRLQRARRSVSPDGRGNPRRQAQAAKKLTAAQPPRFADSPSRFTGFVLTRDRL